MAAWIAAGAAVLSLLVSVIAGLVAWGLRAELATIRAEMGASRADVRASIAEAVNDFYVRVNGNYVKRDLCKTICAATEERIGKVELQVEGMGD